MSEYQEAKRSFKAAAGVGKENRGNRQKPLDGKACKTDTANAAGGLRPKFDPLTSKKPETQKQLKATPGQHLPSQYKTAKLLFKASASRAKARVSAQNDNTAKPTGQQKPLRTAKKKVQQKPLRSTQKGAKGMPDSEGQPIQLSNATPPTAEEGLKLLGLLRPLDNQAFEFGLAAGIETHLVESIKLCGLKRGREKSILDMVSTLCNHLTNREAEITRWIEHSDAVSLKAAEKLGQLVLSRDEAQAGRRDAQRALLAIRAEVLLLRKEFDKCREGLVEMIESFPTAMKDCEDRLRHQLKNHCDGLRSECKSEICDATDELIASHDKETRRLEALIWGLDRSLAAECDKAKTLEERLGTTQQALEKAQEEHTTKQKAAQTELERVTGDLQAANEKIKSMELSHAETLQRERSERNAEVQAMEEGMSAQLEEIDTKVKRSFSSLVEKKNAEITAAVKRADHAEGSAKAAETLLSELKANLATKLKLSTAEPSSEN